MDIGTNRENFLMGSRLLVYNPGDLPINFELKFDNNDRTFWNSRGNHFQIRRLNVQRMPISMAVDLTGLKPQNPEEEKAYKYGNKYFKTLVKSAASEELELIEPSYEDLKDKCRI